MRKVFTVLFLIIICSASFGYIVSKVETGNKFKRARPIILAIANFPDLVREAISELRHRHSPRMVHDDNPFDYCGPTTFDPSFVDSNFVLISAIDSIIGRSKIELLSLADSKVIHEWIPPQEEILNNLPNLPKLEYHPITERNFYVNHPLLMPDGSVVVNVDYGPMIKLDKDSKIEWIINDRYFHHSLELDAEGNIWTCFNQPKSEWDSVFAEKNEVFHENSIAKISQKGEVLYERSLFDVLIHNKLKGVLFGMGEFENDPLHLNDVQPALTDTPYWKKGDLLLSFRNKSLICLFRPVEDRIIWFKTGDWVDQHDVNFIFPDKISLYGNDVIRIIDESETIPVNGTNDVYVINLETGEVTTPFSKMFKELEIYTDFQGRSEILRSGKIFIEETYPGRLLIANEETAEWAYVKCHSDGRLSSLAWCRYLYRDNLNLTFFNN